MLNSFLSSGDYPQSLDIWQYFSLRAVERDRNISFLAFPNDLNSAIF
ncbi:hypothetical protein CKA32_001576 [Geitlerinema sp. FC II]|nr:hypothetical protein CKA32_001576 [Geitlerinema sp. FC II]